jgi:hypothetical protein
MSLVQIAAYIDTHGSFGTTIESLCALLQQHVEKIMYTEDGMLHSVAMEEWKAMWAGVTVSLGEQSASDDLEMWMLCGGKRQVWVFRENAVTAVVKAVAE